jgi:hypothetical protein
MPLAWFELAKLDYQEILDKQQYTRIYMSHVMRLFSVSERMLLWSLMTASLWKQSENTEAMNLDSLKSEQELSNAPTNDYVVSFDSIPLHLDPIMHNSQLDARWVGKIYGYVCASNASQENLKECYSLSHTAHFPICYPTVPKARIFAAIKSLRVAHFTTEVQSFNFGRRIVE